MKALVLLCRYSWAVSSVGARLFAKKFFFEYVQNMQNKMDRPCINTRLYSSDFSAMLSRLSTFYLRIIYQNGAESRVPVRIISLIVPSHCICIIYWSFRRWLCSGSGTTLLTVWILSEEIVRRWSIRNGLISGWIDFCSFCSFPWEILS